MIERQDDKPHYDTLRLLLAARLSKRPGKGQDDDNGKDVERQGLGIETQDQRGRDWAERQHNFETKHGIYAAIKVIDTAADYKSGRIAPWDRPNLKPHVTRLSLMAKYDGILAYKNDRLSRGAPEDEWRIRQWASDNGKVLIIVDGPQWPPRHDGDFWDWTARAKVAEDEWNEMRERSMRAQSELRSRGKLVGRPPWGYEPIGEKYDRTLVPTKAGREFVPNIFKRIADGYSLMAVAKWLDAQGAKPSQSKSWSPKSVAKIIRTRTYTGSRLNGDGLTVMHVEKLVDAKQWDRANKRLDNAPVGRRAPSNGRPALLTGVLFCARCKAPMYRIHPARMSYYYRCSGHHPQRKGCGNMVKLEATDAVVTAFLSMAQGPWKEQRLIPGENHDVELAEIKLAIRDLGAK
ncbi:MAG TPA: recombinase family protein, partial [Streptosporangiaceae bacterium]